MKRVYRLTLLAVVALAAGWTATPAVAAPPGAPVQLTAAEGSGWQAMNRFSLRWLNPEERGTGIVRARFRVLVFDDDSQISTGTELLSGRTSLQPIPAPWPGTFRIEVRLEDGSGALGPPASTVIRFDDGRPGEAMPEPPPGWLSADEFPYQQMVTAAQSGGPSGVAGYALTIADRESVRPCPSGSCDPGQIRFTGALNDRSLPIIGLAEGVHWVSVVAVSGAGLASPTPGAERLRVDRTAPASTLTGVPQGWVREPVTLEATAADSVSGMVPKPATDDGNPVTVIRAANHPARVVQGDSASLMVADEGVTRVQYWARDLAGNVNDGGLTAAGDVHDAPGEATVRIDRRAPVVSVSAPREPADPELLRAVVRDAGSGLAGGVIAYRRNGNIGEFTQLETVVAGETLTARLPSDDLPRGRYEIRAEATDRAGNSGLSTDVGEQLLLELPLKARTAVSIRFAGTGTRSSRSRIRRGVAMRVRGSVRTALGVFAGATVVLEESLEPGSRRRRSLRTVTTDRAGRFIAVVRPGPSRMLRARFAGTRTAQPSTSRGLKVIARDRVRFRVNPGLLVNGGAATMAGRVSGKGAAQPPGGKLVAIQYFDPGRRRWRPVEVIRADRRGRFRYRYRFRTISSAQKILFRAVSLPEAGWPFKTTASHRRPVVVYPSR